MVMGSMFGSGSNGGMNEAMQKLMQRKIMEEMFGLKETEVPVWQAAEPVGQDKNGSWGILGVRLYKATLTSPVPRLILETNGPLTIQPEHVKMLSGFLQRIAGDCETACKDAQEKAKGMEGAEIFAAVLGGTASDSGKK